MPRSQDKENQLPTAVDPPLSALQLARSQILGKRKGPDDTAEKPDDEDGNEYDIGPEQKM